MLSVRMTGLVGGRLGGGLVEKTPEGLPGVASLLCVPESSADGAGQLLIHEGKSNRRSFRLAMLSVRMTGLVGGRLGA